MILTWHLYIHFVSQLAAVFSVSTKSVRALTGPTSRSLRFESSHTALLVNMTRHIRLQYRFVDDFSYHPCTTSRQAHSDLNGVTVALWS
jgi:hypothetical protein